MITDKQRSVKMLLNLTDHSKDPLHRQITIQLARHIIEGDLGAGQELPSLRTLAREQNVSKTTVEQAKKHPGGR
jgi:GntR family transcriptional regulator